MKPVDAQLLPSLDRRDFLVCGSLLFVAGCAGPAVRSQSPEDAEMASIEKQVRLVESVAGPFGMHFVKAESTALVVGLADTGSDPPPSPQRAELMADMQARGVINPNSVLASPSTALVVVRTFLPPAAQRGDTLDLEVIVPPHNDTTSIAGGWLMETRLKEKALLGGADSRRPCARARRRAVVGRSGLVRTTKYRNCAAGCLAAARCCTIARWA